MGLHLYASNKLEKLAELFCKNIYNTPAENIFLPEQVVVQTGGMELFLRKYLAENTEIAANLETPFLNRFIAGAMQALLPLEKYKEYQFSSEQFSPDVLKWRIFDELAEFPANYPEAAQYARTPALRYQLSVQLARVFDRYIWYQHKKLSDWRKEPEKQDHWEKTLYLALCRKIGSSPDIFFNEIQNFTAPARSALLLKRYSLFGVGALPPVLFDFCKKLADFTEIHLFYLNPCGEYWGDMKSDFKLRWEARKNDALEPELQIHNPLLANLGTWGRDFFENTLDVLNGEPGEESFVSPEDPNATLLLRVQQDILSSINGTLETFTEEEKNRLSSDRSISIHNCHSCRREVKVLHDQLLLAMDELQVAPDEIIVMAPDINTYAPYIETVFSAGPLAQSFGISDRSLTTVSSTAENFLELLGIYSSRFSAADICNLLNAPALRENFDLDETNMNKIKEFITCSGISWGEDAQFRSDFSQTPFEEFSWQEGFDRLLLGYAATESDTERLHTPWTPADSVSGTTAELLGKLISITRKLFDCRRFFRELHTPAEWIAFLDSSIEFLYGRAYTRKAETEFIRRSLNNWLKTTEQARSTALIDIKILKSELSAVLDGMNDNRNYLSRGITFCSLVPMRSIPAKVIAVLGLVSGNFPRTDPNCGLNIFPAVRGERSRLLEDRYLFLETILAARERLLLFYPGQGTNGQSGPSASPPLMDLSKYLSDCFGFKETIQFRHGHSAGYFTSHDPNLCSYSEHFYAIAQKLRENTEAQTYTPWYNGSTINTGTEEKSLLEYKISDLAWTLYNPLTTFLKNSFNLSNIAKETFFSEETEPLQIKLSEETTQKLLGSPDTPERHLENLTRSRELPPGAHGSYLLEKKLQMIFSPELDDFRQKLRNSEKITLDVYLDDRYRVYGPVWQVKDSWEQIYYSNYNNARAHLEGYLRHLVNAIQTEGKALSSDLLCFSLKPETLFPISKEEAEGRLKKLLEIAEKAPNKPLPLFPGASWKFAETGDLSKAVEAFATDDQKPYCLEVFGENPFENETFVTEFKELARLVYQPWCKDEIPEKTGGDQ